MLIKIELATSTCAQLAVLETIHFVSSQQYYNICISTKLCSKLIELYAVDTEVRSFKSHKTQVKKTLLEEDGTCTPIDMPTKCGYPDGEAEEVLSKISSYEKFSTLLLYQSDAIKCLT